MLVFRGIIHMKTIYHRLTILLSDINNTFSLYDEKDILSYDGDTAMIIQGRDANRSINSVKVVIKLEESKDI